MQRKIGLLQIPKSVLVQKICGYIHHGWAEWHPSAIEPWTNGVYAQGAFTPASLIWQAEQIGIGLFPSPLSKAWGWDCLSSSMIESTDLAETAGIATGLGLKTVEVLALTLSFSLSSLGRHELLLSMRQKAQIRSMFTLVKFMSILPSKLPPAVVLQVLPRRSGQGSSCN